MPTENTSPLLEMRFSRWLALLPLLFFIVPLIWMSIIRVGSMSVVLGFTFLGVALTSFLALDWKAYWDAVFTGMTRRPVAIFTLIFVAVGIFSKLLTAGNVAGGIIWLSSIADIHGVMFVAFTFIACMLLSTGSGSSMATVLTLGPPLYPAGVILGADPFLLAGALVAGSNFGDNLAPVSDTTIVSAAGQFYRTKEGSADIGGVVRSRFKYAIIAAIISLILYLMIGGSSTFLSPEEASALIAENSYAQGVLMLIPVMVIIFFAVRGTPIATSLAIGLVSGAIVGLGFGILEFSDFIRLTEKNKLKGIIPDGAGLMLRQIIVLALLLGAGEVLMRTGAMQGLMKKLSAMVNTPRGAETTMAMFGGLVGMMGGFAIMGMAIAAPFVNAMGIEQKIHPYRRANILDAIITSMDHAIPWSKQLFILAGLLTAMQADYPFVPVITTMDFFYYCFHPWVLAITMVIFTITGWGRIFEGKNGEVVKGNYMNKTPSAVVVTS